MKKGFTLIELLAVIVILAVIALIAIPIVMDIIEDSRRSAAVASANGYVRAVNYKIAQEALNNRVVDETIDYVIGENALVVTGNNMDTITGSYILAKSSVQWAGLCVNGYSVEYNAITNYTRINNEGNYCQIEEPYVFVEPEAELMSTACTDSSKYTSENAFKIYTVEDLACLSNLSNSGKDFTGKTIYLLRDIDINSENSYIKDNNGNITTAYGDINGDSTTSDLKTELTTGAGFKPIGNSSTPFKGTFLGYAFTISNLKVDRTTSYVGLFGVNQGTINGVKLRNGNFKSSAQYAYVGSIAGHNKGVIRNADVESSVAASTSNSYYTGGITGYNEHEGSITSTLFKGSVTGNWYTAGIAGSSNNGTIEAVIYDSTISNTQRGGKIIGNDGSSATGYNYNTTITATYGKNGTTILGMTLECLDEMLDTYIGGDNNNDKYYFDYDEDGNITVFSTERNPIEELRYGSGTAESPYLIKNIKDWKKASATGTQSKYYSLDSNLDYTNKNFYVLGTNKNHFNGHINGNMNTISNVSISGNTYVGVFGYNTGVIEGFVFDNVSATANGTYVGLIAGYNTGTVNGIVGKDINVSGAQSSNYVYTGGITGRNYGTIKNVDIRGTILGNTSSSYYTAGIAGYNEYDGKIIGAMFSGSIRGNWYTGGIVGENNNGTIKAVIFDSTIYNTERGGRITGRGTANVTGFNYNTTNTATYGENGSVIPCMTLEALDSVLDTYIGGDNDSDGYYFDYDETGDITVFSTNNIPIENTLAGSGTSTDPYQIWNANDWKMASATVTQGKYYVVRKNIDFTNANFYALGTNTNKFNGNINGKMHTISNISVGGHSYVGLFGHNVGTIEGFRFNNVTVTLKGTYGGLIAGYNEGTINGIAGRNINVSGAQSSNYVYTGGITGRNYGTIKNVDIRGTILGNTSSSYYTAGIAGYNEYNGSVIGAVFSGNISGNWYTGGIVGDNNNGTIKAVIFNSTIYNTERGGKITGRGSANVTGYNYNTTNTATYGTNGTTLSTLTLEGVSSVLDINDSDHDGYYFGYDGFGGIELFGTPDIDEVYEEDASNPTHGGIVYLNPKNISQTCTKANVDSNVNSNGKLTGVKDGCMKFYIFEDDGTNYKMILDHNTSGNVSWAIQSDFIEAGGDLTEWQTNEGSTSRGPVTANKRLLSDTAGWSGNPRLPSANEIAHITGADTALSWNSSKTYASPVTDKSTQIGNYYFDGSGSNYSGWTSQVANSTNKSKYAWLFDNTTNCLQYGCKKEDNNEYSGSAVHGYWTSDASNINYPWAVVESGQLGRNDVTNESNVGIRPVITLSKTSVTVH